MCNGVTACVTRLVTLIVCILGVVILERARLYRLVTLIVCILGVVILERARLYQNVGSNGRVQ